MASTMTSGAGSAPRPGPREYRMYVDGAWVGAASGRTYDDLDPFTGEVFGIVPAGGREDARRAIEAAAEAFLAWWKTPPGEKLRLSIRRPPGTGLVFYVINAHWVRQDFLAEASVMGGIAQDGIQIH